MMWVWVSPSCASVGIWELLLLELLLLLLLLCEVMEGLDCSFLEYLGPADEDEEVDEPPRGREPSFGCLWEPPFLTGLAWKACGVWFKQCVWGQCTCSRLLAPLRSWLWGCDRHGCVGWMGVDRAAGGAGNQTKDHIFTLGKRRFNLENQFGEV